MLTEFRDDKAHPHHHFEESRKKLTCHIKLTMASAATATRDKPASAAAPATYGLNKLKIRH